MKTKVQNLFLLPALIACLGLVAAGRVTAQTFTPLHSFTALVVPPCNCINADGALPYAGLVLSGNTLYGTAVLGGSSGVGLVFKLNADGTGFAKLHYFTAVSGPDPYSATNSDGAEPYAGLILSGSMLSGTAYYGGLWGDGTIFAVNTNGTGFTNLHNFSATPGPLYTNADGAGPRGSLILSGNALYGTAQYGGASGYGTVFKLNADGTGFTNLHSFTVPTGSLSTNSDGAEPFAGLVLSGNTLYGTANQGGTAGKGTVFAVNTNGTSFTNLHSFTATSGSLSTNRDGANPYAGLLLSGGALYGTAYYGGISGNGAVFKLNTDGAGFTNLHSFTALIVNSNADGAHPYAALVLSGDTLYGAAESGGSSVRGTVFAGNTNGSGFTVLHNFVGSDGAGPLGQLILSGKTLYGTTYAGGSSPDGAFNGTVFSLALPQLAIIRSGAGVILTWPTNAAGFVLQSASNLVSPADWTAVSPGPVVLNGRNTVTNSLASGTRFFRLFHP